MDRDWRTFQIRERLCHQFSRSYAAVRFNLRPPDALAAVEAESELCSGLIDRAVIHV